MSNSFIFALSIFPHEIFHLGHSPVARSVYILNKGGIYIVPPAIGHHKGTEPFPRCRTRKIKATAIMSGSRQILTPRKRILRTLPSEIAVVAQQEGPLRRKVEIRHCNNGGRVRVRKQLGRVAQLFRRDKGAVG